MNRPQALECLERPDAAETKVADVYDTDPEVREALSVLIPSFEYPDISYLTLAQVRRRCGRKTDFATL